MKRYNAEMDKYKALYFTPHTVLKAYILSIVISILICSIIFLPLINLLFLVYYLKLIIGIALITAILCNYLVLYFKDKILLNYNEKMKEINLLFIRLYDITIVSIVCLIFYVIYVIVF